jgi:hypothetical protein
VTDRAASATVKVAVEPMSAFTAFTDEIDSWWVRGPINFFDSGRAVAMRIEPGVGGRVLEVYDEARAGMRSRSAGSRSGNRGSS